MDIETAATPAGGEDTHVSASEAVTPEAQAPAEGIVATEPSLEDIAPVTTDDDEYEEIERGDKKYRIPKPLKGELLMHQDYTQKTMALAEQRRAFEAREAALQQAETLSTEERRAYGRYEILNDQVAAYEKVDWDALEQADPREYDKHQRILQKAERDRDKIVQSLQQAHAQRAAQAQQETAKHREEVEAQVAKKIPNWPAKRAEIEAFATRYGYEPQRLAETARVNDYELLHLANEGFKFIERQRAAAKAAAAGAIKPAPEVGGTAAAGTDPNNLSMAAYIAARKSGAI